MIKAMFFLSLGLAAASCRQGKPSAGTGAADTSTTTAARQSGTTTDPRVAANQSQLSETRLHIDGMVCQGCAQAAEGCLKGIDGVVGASVSLQDRQADVSYDPSRTSPQKMIAALEATDRGQAPAFHVKVNGDDGR